MRRNDIIYQDHFLIIIIRKSLMVKMSSQRKHAHQFSSRLWGSVWGLCKAPASLFLFYWALKTQTLENSWKRNRDTFAHYHNASSQHLYFPLPWVTLRSCSTSVSLRVKKLLAFLHCSSSSLDISMLSAGEWSCDVDFQAGCMDEDYFCAEPKCLPGWF